jgi:hypothetical protein
MTYYLHKIYFYVKIRLFVTAKSDQDPTDPRCGKQPGSGFALKLNLRSSLTSRIQLTISSDTGTVPLTNSYGTYRKVLKRTN